MRDLIKLALLNISPGIKLKLYNHFGGASGIFNSTKGDLIDIGVTSTTIDKILIGIPDSRIDEELYFIDKYKIRILEYGQEEYPSNLLSCCDAPTTLFAKGDINFNDTDKFVSVIGTRKNSPYGSQACRDIIKDISIDHPDAVIVSGLAYGIDSIAHKAALEFNLRTIAVVAHGLNTLYPSDHKNLAKEIINKGGAIITEFPSESFISKSNFISRNRIIAGISQSCLLVESPEKGGSMITMNISNSYGRELFTIPARINDSNFKGNLSLISSNMALMITNGNDLAQNMGWEKILTTEKSYKNIFNTLAISEEEEEILTLFDIESSPTLEYITNQITTPMNKILSTLTALEMKGYIKSTKGKTYIKLQN